MVEHNTEAVTDLLNAMQYIANLGGNLPDERLTSRTGANDAVDRGLKLVAARDMARAALKKYGRTPLQQGDKA